MMVVMVIMRKEDLTTALYRRGIWLYICWYIVYIKATLTMYILL